MRRGFPILLLVALGCGDEPEPTLEERLSAQPGFWFEAPDEGALDEHLERMAAIGYADGYETFGGTPGVFVPAAEKTEPGVNLYNSGHAPAAYLMDAAGEILHEWSYPFEKLTGAPPMAHSSQDAWRRVRLLEDGSLLAIHEGLCLLKVDRDSNLEWVFGGFAHHDLEVLEDGRILTLTRKEKLLPNLNGKEPLLVDSVAILSPEGKLEQEVSVYECLLNSRYADVVREAAKKGGDCLHTNSVHRLDGSLASEHPAFAEGNVLVCLRDVDRVGVMDLDARRFVWMTEGDWEAPHDPTLLPGKRLLIFDNMGHGGYSRGLEVEWPSGAEKWSYVGSPPEAFFSVFCGTAERLPGGNTLLTESTAGRALEIAPDGALVWAFRSPHRAGEAGDLVAALFEVQRLPRPAWLGQ